MKMQIRTYPDVILRKRASPLRQVTGAELRKLQDMLELMYESDGIGIAGPQVGWSARVVALDVKHRRCGERIFINPRIVDSGGLDENEEGCLSLPGIKAVVPRSGRIAVAAYTVKGERLELHAEGLEAVTWQHEIDHLNGVLFIDKISASDRMAVRRHLKELENHPVG